MTPEFVYESWAPPGARWSPWVKPVLFACMRPELDLGMPAMNEWNATWAPSPASSDTVLVIDLPGMDSVQIGLALAAQGYQPVPLYNAIPGPSSRLDPSLSTAAVVDLGPVAAALWQGAARLRQASLLPESPPAFLLDWNRRGSALNPSPGQFDNRSVSFTTDFPSANFLLSHGLRRVVLVQPIGEQPQSDLAHTLKRWQDQGLAMELRLAAAPEMALPLQIERPSWFGWVCQRVLAGFGLRRSGIGGFGGWVPQASSG